MSENNTQRKDFDRIDRMNQFYRQGLIETTKVKLKIPPHFNPLPCGYFSNGGDEETPSPLGSTQWEAGKNNPSPLVRGERWVRGRMKPQMNTEEYKS